MSSPFSLLVIEHHDEHRVRIESALGNDGVSIETVDTGEAALLRLGMTNFDCVVVGSPVPVTFGAEPSTMLDLFDLLAPNFASRLIVVARTRATKVIRRALQMQVYAVFLEPFDPAELRETVGMCLRREVPPRRLHGTSAEIERLIVDECSEEP